MTNANTTIAERVAAAFNNDGDKLLAALKRADVHREGTDEEYHEFDDGSRLEINFISDEKWVVTAYA